MHEVIPPTKPLRAKPKGARDVEPRPSVGRLLVHGAIGWVLCAAVMGLVDGMAAPLIFVLVSTSYFAGRRTLRPLAAALAFTAIVAMLDLVVVAGILRHGLTMFSTVTWTWLRFAFVFLATWVTGRVVRSGSIGSYGRSGGVA